METKITLQKFLKAVGFTFLFIGVSNSLSQSIHPLEPISEHYKMFFELSAAPNPSRFSLDTMTFSWTEYSTGAIMNSWHTMYLSEEADRNLAGLIRYPANSSDQTAAELDYLLGLQQKRTQEEINRANFIANIPPTPNIGNRIDSSYSDNARRLFYIANPVGNWYNPQNFPATAELLMNCLQDIRLTEYRLKRHFKRSRPYHLEARLNPLAKILTPTFPSGHTLWAYTNAYLFSEIIPEKREAFLNRAEEVAWSREIMGIHFPSDNEASRVIAWYVLKFWYNNPQFVRDFERAKTEWQTNKKQYK